MLLNVRRPKVVTTGRTQSYRVILTLTSEDPQEDVALFVCVNDGVSPQFDRVVGALELRQVTTTPTATEFRTHELDLLLAGQPLAEALILEVVADLQALVRVPPGGINLLSGATVIP